MPRRPLAALLLVGITLVAACGGDEGPEERSGATTAVPTPSSRVPVPGFGEVGITIEPEGGTARSWCALAADTPAQHGRGMMERRDFSGYDAMLFRFQQDVDIGFFMRNTPLPLSIAWFDGGGAYVGEADMAPCADRDGCPTYDPPAPYRFALEVAQGDLDRLGAGPGSRLTVGSSPCPAPSGDLPETAGS